MRPVTAAFWAAFFMEFLMVRSVNAAALAIAANAEGCVLRAYRDPAGVLTAGYGHTGPDVLPGMVISQEQANDWRAADMARAAAFVASRVKVPLSDNQFSALAEFTYNVGTGSFAGSTLLRVLNQGRYDLVPGQLLRWTRAGGRVMPGLMTRRAQEAALFVKPDALVVANAAPAVATCRPCPPSLPERLRAWLHRFA